MTNEQKANNIAQLKEKIKEINLIISEFNKDKENPLSISIYQKNFHPLMNYDAVKNSIKYLECTITETLSY
jgi:hypothetical protein